MASTVNEKIILAGFVVPHADKRERSIDLWRAIADDARATEQGKVSIGLYEEQDDGDDGAFLVLDEFASTSVRDAFVGKPSHMAISAKVNEEGLIQDADLGFYKHVLGAGKMIGGHQGEGKFVMASFVVVEEGKLDMALEHWEKEAEVVRAEQDGEGVAMGVFAFHDGVDGRKGGGDRFFEVYEFPNEDTREELLAKRQRIETMTEGSNKKHQVFRSVNFNFCKHILGSGSGIGVT